MFGKYKQNKRTRGNVSSLFKESEKVKRGKLYRELWGEGTTDKSPGSGEPEKNLTKMREAEKLPPGMKIIEVSVRAKKGQREPFYKAMTNLLKTGKGYVSYYLDDLVATIVVRDEMIDEVIMALDDVGLTDHGVFDKPFDPDLV